MIDESDLPTPPEIGQPSELAVDPKLLECLVCPISQGPLEYDRARSRLISRKAGLAYPIRNGVPIMLEHEAEAFEP